MIVDSHAHVFPPMGGRSGFPTVREHLQFVQQMIMFHHQPVRRADDNSRYVGENTLYDGRDTSMRGLADVGFRGGEYGRFAWSADGVDYYTQYLPPTLPRLQATPEQMIAQMDYLGVDRAVIQTGHSYGRINRYVSDAVRGYPSRLWGLAMVDEWAADQPGQLRALDRAVNHLGLHGLWFQSGNIRLYGRTESIDAPTFHGFWDRVVDLDIPVFLNLTALEPGVQPYLDELEAFDRWTRRYPSVPVLLAHGLPLFRFLEGGEIRIPSQAWKLLSHPNVLVELLIPIFQGSIWEYPFDEAHPIVREYYERLGPEKLAWGSDMPNVERHCTYRQSLDYLRLHCDFISPDDMAQICGGNVARLFGA